MDHKFICAKWVSQSQKNIQLNYVNDGLYHLTGEGVSTALSVDVAFFIVALHQKHQFYLQMQNKIIHKAHFTPSIFLLLKHRAQKTMTCPSVGGTHLHQPALVSIHFYFVSIT